MFLGAIERETCGMKWVDNRKPTESRKIIGNYKLLLITQLSLKYIVIPKIVLKERC